MFVLVSIIFKFRFVGRDTWPAMIRKSMITAVHPIEDRYWLVGISVLVLVLLVVSALKKIVGELKKVSHLGIFSRKYLPPLDNFEHI